MAISDQKLTVLEIINEVLQKLGLNTVATVDANKHSTVAVKYLNDVVDEISDFGRWQEQVREVLVTAVASVAEYSIETSAVVENIYEIAFYGRSASLQYITIEDMRRLRRVNGGQTGTPNQYTIIGTDSAGNPKFRVYPMPGTAQVDQTFDVLYYQKPKLYTISDGALLVPFPAKLVIQGLLAAMLLDEGGNDPTGNTRYLTTYQQFRSMLKNAFNRYNGDTGVDTYFKPVRVGR